MQEPTKPQQDYLNALNYLEAVRLEFQSKGRDGDVHRGAVQAVVELFNNWTALTNEVADLRKRIDALTKLQEPTSSNVSATVAGPA